VDEPDWYVFFLEGSLRLFPPWEIRVFGHTVPAVFWPGIVLPTLLFLTAVSYPFIEARLTGDQEMHSSAQKPREAPVRSALGAAAATFYVVLVVMAAEDIFTHDLDLAIEPVLWTGRVASFLLPAVAAAMTYRGLPGAAAAHADAGASRHCRNL
jgi:ubiquinol-cytochrome c reductase cytochrome b subunit